MSADTGSRLWGSCGVTGASGLFSAVFTRNPRLPASLACCCCSSIFLLFWPFVPYSFLCSGKYLYSLLCLAVVIYNNTTQLGTLIINTFYIIAIPRSNPHPKPPRNEANWPYLSSRETLQPGGEKGSLKNGKSKLNSLVFKNIIQKMRNHRRSTKL